LCNSKDILGGETAQNFFTTFLSCPALPNTLNIYALNTLITTAKIQKIKKSLLKKCGKLLNTKRNTCKKKYPI